MGNGADDKNFFGDDDIHEEDEVIVDSIMVNFGQDDEEDDSPQKEKPEPLKIVEAEIKSEAELNQHYND